MVTLRGRQALVIEKHGDFSAAFSYDSAVSVGILLAGQIATDGPVNPLIAIFPSVAITAMPNQPRLGDVFSNPFEQNRINLISAIE